MLIQEEVDTLNGGRGTVRSISARPQRSFFISLIGSRRNSLAGAGSSSSKVSFIQQMLLFFFKSAFLTFSPGFCLSVGAIAAYNMGDGRVDSYANVDAKTTGKDYSNDVVARAQWYKQNGF